MANGKFQLLKLALKYFYIISYSYNVYLTTRAKRTIKAHRGNIAISA